MLILQEIFKCDYEFNRFISHAVTEKICDAVRTKILDWAIELEKQGILGENLLFTPEERHKAMTYTINIDTLQGQAFFGSVQNSTMEQNSSSFIRRGNKEDLVKVLQENEIQSIDIDRLMNAIETDSLPITAESFGEKVTNWINSMIAKAVNGSWNVTASVAANLLMLVISQYYGLS